MQIVIVTTIPYTINKFYAGQLATLSDAGFSVTCMAGPDSEGFEAVDNVTYRELKRLGRGVNPIADLCALLELVAYFRRDRPTIVQYSTPKAALIASVASLVCRVPVRIYFQWGLYYEGRRGLMRLVYLQLERIACRASTEVVPDCKASIRSGLKVGLYGTTPVRLIRHGSSNGIDPTLYDRESLRARRRELRAQVEAPLQELWIGTIMRVHEDKGVWELVSSVHALRAEGVSAVFIVIGRMELSASDAGRFYEACTEAAIMYLGEVPQADRWCAAFDIFVLPSHREGLSLSLIEAAASGCAIVATNVGGSREVVPSARFGVLVPPRDRHALTEALRVNIADPARRAMVGEAARQRALSRWRRDFLWRDLLHHKIERAKEVSWKGYG